MTFELWLGAAVAAAALAFNLAGIALLFAILKLQDMLPLNPAGMAGLDSWLAFNTAVSFVTNTNWQNYGGETTLSHFSQMAGLTVQNFLSAATGIAVAFAFIRALARSGVATLGNFWVDVSRIALWLLLPACIVLTLAYVAMGVPQTLAGSVTATTLEGAEQTIAVGPVASQLAIKMLGTNGGGFFNVNSAHPFENPSALSNMLQMPTIFVLGAGLTLTFGRAVGNMRQGWTILAAMLVLFTAGVTLLYWAEAAGNPIHAGITGNMEGKEVRFGIAATALFAAITTAASCGAVIGMHDSLMPLGGLAKYFTVLPAIFVALYPGLGTLNLMRLGSPESAILSAIIFNAVIIPLLVPLALRGVKYRAGDAGSLLARNLAIYGLGGLVAPFIGIKLIDLAVTSLNLA